MNSLQVFDSLEIRFVEHPDGKYEFGMVADDLAKVLEHTNSRVMADGIDDDWKGVSNVYTPGGTQSVTVIWEPGVYQLLSKSRKPKAKPFQKWLFEEVLPTIRKTGSYNKHTEPVRALPQRDTIDYVQAAAILPTLRVNNLLRQLLEDALTDDLELMRNQKALVSGGTGKRQFTIAKVRAKELGYPVDRIGSGSQLGRFIAQSIKPAMVERVGKYMVNHYEVTPELDEAIHAYFR